MTERGIERVWEREQANICKLKGKNAKSLTNAGVAACSLLSLIFDFLSPSSVRAHTLTHGRSRLDRFQEKAKPQ